jgi:hypothetical protein
LYGGSNPVNSIDPSGRQFDLLSVSVANSIVLALQTVYNGVLFGMTLTKLYEIGQSVYYGNWVGPFHGGSVQQRRKNSPSASRGDSRPGDAGT